MVVTKSKVSNDLVDWTSAVNKIVKGHEAKIVEFNINLLDLSTQVKEMGEHLEKLVGVVEILERRIDHFALKSTGVKE